MDFGRQTWIKFYLRDYCSFVLVDLPKHAKLSFKTSKRQYKQAVGTW